MARGLDAQTEILHCSYRTTILYCLAENRHRFLDALGIVRIPAAQVTLHPFLLGQNFQRAADKAILRKNGVTDKKINSIEK